MIPAPRRRNLDLETLHDDKISDLEDCIFGLRKDLKRAQEEKAALEAKLIEAKARQKGSLRTLRSRYQAKVNAQMAMQEEIRRLNALIESATDEPNARSLIEQLAEENKQLREALQPKEEGSLPGNFDEILSPSEKRVLALLLARESLSHEAIFHAMDHVKTDHNSGPGELSVSLIFKLRRKTGIDVESIFGWGYRMTKESKEAYGRLLGISRQESDHHAGGGLNGHSGTSGSALPVSSGHHPLGA